MTKLSWNDTGERRYEAGADRGVLYLEGVPGVAWGGLVAVNERPDGGEPQGYYMDGVKYYNVATSEEFAATLEAFSSPREFGVCDGTKSLANGLFATGQKRKQFGFTYRTLVGNDTMGLDYGYKIHLVYNALAAATERNNGTLSNSPSASTKSWDVSTSPFVMAGIKPTAHLVIDSRDADALSLAYFESVLYGANGMNPRLPSPEEVVGIFNMPAEEYPFQVNIIGTASNTKTTVRNLATNPSFETAVSPTTYIEVRRNYNPNPLPNSLTGYTRAGAATSTITYETSGGPSQSGGKWIKNAITLAGSDNQMQIAMVNNAGPLTGCSAYVFASKATQLVFKAWTYDAAGAYLGASNDMTSTPFNVLANTWTLVDVKFATQPPVAYSRFTPILRSNSLTWAAGDVYGVALWTPSNVPGPPFTGSYQAVPDVDLSAAWTSTVDASQSILRGVAVAEAQNSGTRPAIHSSIWASRGSKSIRMIPTSYAAASDTYIAPFGDLGAMRSGMQAGKTYTVKAKCRLSTAQTGTISSNARRIIAYYRDSGGTYQTVSSSQAANASGVTELSLTFSIPVGATEAFIRLYNGTSPSNGDIWWDEIMLVEGAYTGTYVDGSFGQMVYQNQETDASWDGVANASTSKVSYYNALIPEGTLGDAYVIDNVLWVYTDAGYWVSSAILPTP